MNTYTLEEGRQRELRELFAQHNPLSASSRFRRSSSNCCCNLTSSFALVEEDEATGVPLAKTLL
ncbi:MAG: hypothetical protein F6K17_08120, partial [Okeania sp. SIO3C4]|nr:hypothetical protein [Okeania sp. SIO3C4]